MIARQRERGCELRHTSMAPSPWLVGTLVWALALVSCAPTAYAPEVVPPAASQDAATAEWIGIVEAAKRERTVVVIGPQGSDARDAFTVGFQRKYPEIQVDFAGVAGNQIAPKLLTELAAGQHLNDIIVTGTTTAIEALRPADAIVPLQPYLVGPNVRDPSVWRGGKPDFADEAGQHNLVFGAYVKEGFVYNPDLVSPADFKSYKDLLDPKWRGKIVWRNPTAAGGGLASATFFYTTNALGRDFIQRLLAQDPVYSSDDRQVLDWVARGQYPIAIGPSNVLTNEFIERGLPVRLLDGDQLAEGTYITAGNGTLVVVRDPPHPNATKVYLDYLLSKDGQLEWSKGVGFPSLRRDVPVDHLVRQLVPKEGVDYQENHAERYVKLREEVVEFLQAGMPR